MVLLIDGIAALVISLAYIGISALRPTVMTALCQRLQRAGPELFEVSTVRFYVIHDRHTAIVGMIGTNSLAIMLRTLTVRVSLDLHRTDFAPALAAIQILPRLGCCAASVIRHCALEMGHCAAW